MERKIICAVPLLCVLILTVASCRKKYDYGNIVTPDILAGNTDFVEKEIPELGSKVPLVADWLLDEAGLEKLRTRIEIYPAGYVELDLSACQVPSGEYGDVALPPYFFEGMNNLGSVVLPERLLTVSEGLFKDCLNLQKVTLSSRLASIEGHAFQGCVSLSKIYTSGNPLFIFSYSGDGLEHPDMDASLKKVKVYYGNNEVDYINWYQFCWDYSKRIEPKKVVFADIWASSFEDGYGPDHLADGTWGTWFENAPGEGIGQEIVMYFNRLHSVSTITFRNGNGNTKNFWKSNRVRDLDIYFGNETSPVSITLRDSCESQTFRFSYGNRKLSQFEKIRLVIRSVYKGGDGNETGIAEICINDEKMDGYVEDSYTKALYGSIPFDEKEGTEKEFRIWRPVEGNPVLLMFDRSQPAEDLHTDSLRCMVFNGEQWTDAPRRIWAQLQDAVESAQKAGKRVEYSFDAPGGMELSVQLKREVAQFKDASYGKPYRFVFDGSSFVAKVVPDFSSKKISVSVENFFERLKTLKPDEIYRIDLKGVLDRTFFDRMQEYLAADKELAIRRNYILNMWECTYAPDLQGTLFQDSLCGYFIQLILPSSTKRLLKSSLAVAADIITIPSSVEKIEAGAFVSSRGSPYDFYGNGIIFDGGKFARGYSLEGRLLLESIPDSGGRKRVLMYCGNAKELLGIEDLSNRKLVLPDNVTEIAPYAFYGADLDSIGFSSNFEQAGERCFDMARVKSVDLSRVDVNRFSMETVRQFGLLLSSNPDAKVHGDFYCISASGKMTEGLVNKISRELEIRGDKKVYLDLGGTSLIWNDELKKFNPLPDMFLYGFQNLYWVRMGNYNYLPQNTCRDCHQLKYVQFIQEPDVIAEPSFKGCHPTAVAQADSREYPLWEYAQRKK